MTMKSLLFLSLVAVALAQGLDVSDEDQAQWELFKIEHSRSYADEKEEQMRLQIFAANLKFIREHNQKYENGEVTFAVGVNKFADLTNKEFTAIVNGYRAESSKKSNAKTFDLPEDLELPASVDWRKKGAVTDVKDQGMCGSCWAFSTTGSLEGQTFLKTQTLVSLSEQNLVDCSTDEGNYGCDGGWMDQAFEYIENNNGIDTEKFYPYKGVDQKCHYKAKGKGSSVTSYVDIPSGSEKKLQAAVAKVGPVSVAIDASADAFQFYKKGVYKVDDCATEKEDLDHAVLAVGYGKAQKGGDFWLVKNSWGTNWGMNGYILMARNNNNMCGIATAASYPQI